MSSIEETEDKVIFKEGDSSCEILKYGATVISWKLKGQEQLWLSSAAKLDGSKPVRGGIPLVFPIFGKSQDPSHPTFELPQHGFVRNSYWDFLGKTSSNPPTIQFGLGPENVQPDLLQKWGQGKYDFTLLLSISLNQDKLVTIIEIQNSGKLQFDFNWLFHTYYNIPDITEVMVSNLVDQHVNDKIIKSTYTEKSPVIQFHEELDRVYEKIDEDKQLQLLYQGKVLFNLFRHNLPDVVVWNPWINKSQSMADFEPKSGYQNMVCVEPGHVSDFITLKSGQSWTASQTISTGGEIKIQSNIFQ